MSWYIGHIFSIACPHYLFLFAAVYFGTSFLDFDGIYDVMWWWRVQLFIVKSSFFIAFYGKISQSEQTQWGIKHWKWRALSPKHFFNDTCLIHHQLDFDGCACGRILVESETSRRSWLEKSKSHKIPQTYHHWRQCRFHCDRGRSQWRCQPKFTHRKILAVYAENAVKNTPTYDFIARVASVGSFCGVSRNHVGNWSHI